MNREQLEQVMPHMDTMLLIDKSITTADGVESVRIDFNRIIIEDRKIVVSSLRD